MKIIHNQRLWKAYCCVVVVKVFKTYEPKIAAAPPSWVFGLNFQFVNLEKSR